MIYCTYVAFRRDESVLERLMDEGRRFVIEIEPAPKRLN
jgi:hypothetical protein